MCVQLYLFYTPLTVEQILLFKEHGEPLTHFVLEIKHVN